MTPTSATTTTTTSTASPQAAAIVTLYRSWIDRMAAQPDMDLDTMRDLFEEWHVLTAEPTEVTYEEADADGVTVMWCRPVGGAADRVLIWTHGGGYVVGSRHSHRKVAGHLAKAVGCAVVVPEYRRAPEHPHPAQLEDALTVYRWVLAQGIEPGHMATTGDSAGGSLCTALVLRLRDLGEPLPAAIMPMSPWYDTEGKGETLESRAGVDALVKKEILTGMAQAFLGGGPSSDPYANPLYADPTGLPPMFIQVGDHEGLLDDSRRFAANAQAAGVDVTLEVAPEMQHVFQFMAGSAPEADEAIERLARWVRPRLGLS